MKTAIFTSVSTMIWRDEIQERFWISRGWQISSFSSVRRRVDLSLNWIMMDSHLKFGVN